MQTPLTPITTVTVRECRTLYNRSILVDGNDLLQAFNDLKKIHEFGKRPPPVLCSFCCNLIGVKMCSACPRSVSVRYCSKECQIKDWPKHKLVCWRAEEHLVLFQKICGTGQYGGSIGLRHRFD